MRNFGSGWVRAAQVGTVFVSLAGCEEKSEQPDAMAEQRDAMVEQQDAMAEQPDAMAEQPDAAGLPSCNGAQRAPIGACVGGLESEGGQPATLTGMVEAIERPEQLRGCTVHIGNAPFSNSTGRGYVLVINDGETTVRLEIYLPWAEPLVNVGDTVSIEHYSQFYIEAPSEGWVRLRDEDGELLFWAATSGQGFAPLENPPEVAVQTGEPICQRDETRCENVRHAGFIAQSGDSGVVPIAWGGRADVGDYVVLHGDNTFRPQSSCPWSSGRHVMVAAVRGSQASLAEE